ncbi:MAG: ABC transporter substrate-binding protein [Firmicutes bacterium]|nr:ABC transporter substrate-binding protein [Bacillota bacterium]
MKKIMCIFLSLAIMAFAFSGCSKTNDPGSSGNEQVQQPPEQNDDKQAEEDDNVDPGETPEDRRANKTLMKIALLKGPTAMGAAMLMNENENGFVFGNYSFEVLNTPSEVTAKILNGDADVAAVPVNMAASLYNKTNGDVLIAAINTLGNLYIVENGQSISSAADLSGKTIVSAGQGAVPEYVLNLILSKSGVTDATVEFVASHSDAVAAIAAGEADVAMLPEPFATMAEKKVEGLNRAVDLSEVWDEYSYEEENVANTLPMGCIVVRRSFLEENEKDFRKFMDEYDYFMDETIDDPEKAAEYIVGYGILDDKELAQAAIPSSNLKYIEGTKMLRLVDNFLAIIHELNPESVGGTVPDENFYYIRN